MSAIFIVLPAAIILAGGFVILFLVSARNGQFDDLDTPAIRILFDETPMGGTKPGNAETPGVG